MHRKIFVVTGLGQNLNWNFVPVEGICVAVAAPPGSECGVSFPSSLFALVESMLGDCFPSLWVMMNRILKDAPNVLSYGFVI